MSNPIDVAFAEFERFVAVAFIDGCLFERMCSHAFFSPRTYRQGIKPLVKRRTATGELQDASERDLKFLGDQSRFATTANNLQNLKPEERSLWAKDLKEKANQLFKDKEFQKASECYFEVFQPFVDLYITFLLVIVFSLL